MIGMADVVFRAGLTAQFRKRRAERAIASKFFRRHNRHIAIYRLALNLEYTNAKIAGPTIPAGNDAALVICAFVGVGNVGIAFGAADFHGQRPQLADRHALSSVATSVSLV